MQDISAKLNTLRIARAESVLELSSEDTVAAIRNHEVPKGNIFEMAKAAGLLAIKKTYEVIPDCHPLPIEAASFSFSVEDLTIRIELEVKTIYKTGVEVEAMHGVAIAALTMYDMLKPLDKGIAVRNIRLLEKKGGKSGHIKNRPDIDAAIIVCSDSVSRGLSEDTSGDLIRQKLGAFDIAITHFEIIPDEKTQITERVEQFCSEGIKLVILTGGTGLSVRDVTPETIQPLLDREIPAIMEAARAYGMQRTPLAMLSRSIAGMKGNSLVLTLPGSAQAIVEYMNVIFPHVLHIFDVSKGQGHN